MTEPVPAEDLTPKTAGQRLREAREAQGLSLAEIAARTRVPLRQLEAIETDNFTGLPSATYAVGFAKAYARAVGMDEVAVAREVRSQNDLGVRRTEYEQYEIKEPSRTPSGGVVLATLAALALLLIATALWFGTNLFRGDEEAPAAITAGEIAPAVQSAAPAAVVPQGGLVVLTATDEVWLRVYDAAGKTLFRNTLKSGERYEVPADANGPMINVGRPDKLQVTVNGSVVPPLGDGRVAIKDVGISATVLQARGSGNAPTVSPVAAPAAPTDDRGTGTRPGAGSRDTVPPAFRGAASEAPARRESPPVVTRPNGGSPAEVAPAPAPDTAPATAP